MDHLDDAVDVLVGEGASSASSLAEARTTMPRASSSLRTAAPDCTFFAAVRLIVRPAPWQVLPKERSNALVGAHEHVGGGAHAAGDQHRLADPLVDRGGLRMRGAEGARRSLAVDDQILLAVPLQLGDVVGDVVDQPAAPPAAPNALRKTSRAAWVIACRFAKAKLAAAHMAPK